LVLFWISFANFGSALLILDQFCLYWISSANFGSVWLILDQFG